eukprot:TRINITY_DN774319_c0_g1_i1.p1 TRINITY_DN774319_c0_g1~~TRINITY_DN774319_c0_g1_i1.p1  ORF type:complete len:229 (+),score=29.92 TRINITY_DN774319_c0_g1_i1:144-830(+)
MYSSRSAARLRPRSAMGLSKHLANSSSTPGFKHRPQTADSKRRRLINSSSTPHFKPKSLSARPLQKSFKEDQAQLKAQLMSRIQRFNQWATALGLHRSYHVHSTLLGEEETFNTADLPDSILYEHIKVHIERKSGFQRNCSVESFTKDFLSLQKSVEAEGIQQLRLRVKNGEIRRYLQTKVSHSKMKGLQRPPKDEVRSQLDKLLQITLEQTEVLRYQTKMIEKNGWN